MVTLEADLLDVVVQEAMPILDIIRLVTIHPLDITHQTVDHRDIIHQVLIESDHQVLHTVETVVDPLAPGITAVEVLGADHQYTKKGLLQEECITHAVALHVGTLVPPLKDQDLDLEEECHAHLLQ